VPPLKLGYFSESRSKGIFRGMDEQIKRQQLWNRDMQQEINTASKDHSRFRALEETVAALEAKLVTLIENS
jgi:hypothetical protein